jgi:hypothetical protein
MWGLENTFGCGYNTFITFESRVLYLRVHARHGIRLCEAYT